MPPRAIPFFAAAAVLGLITLSLQLLPVAREATEPPAEPPATVAAPETLALPDLAPGARVSDVSAWFPSNVVARRVSPQGGADRAAFEWSEPAGRYALFEFERGGIVVGFVRRPWTAWLPAVEASRLPAAHVGMSRAEIERVLGRGWPVMRAIAEPWGGPVVTHAWAIRDRGVGTGAVLLVGFRDERAVAITHPWAHS